MHGALCAVVVQKSVTHEPEPPSFIVIGRKPWFTFHHRPLPEHSTLLSGRVPRDETSFQSAQLQIWYNHTDHSWVGAGEPPHLHRRSDECFVVLAGALIVEVDGQRHRIGPRGFAVFRPSKCTRLSRSRRRWRRS